MIVLLSLVGLFFFSHPSFQTKFVNRFTQKINQNFETDINFKGVEIGFDGSVNLNSFFIADHHSDTLFYAKNLKTDLQSFRELVGGNLFFSITEFEEVFLKITQYEGEKNNSLFQFLQKLLPTPNLNIGLPFYVKIDDLTITDGRLLMTDKNNQSEPMEFDNVKLQATDFIVSNDDLEIKFKKLKFDSKYFGKINLNNADFYYNPCEIDIRSYQFSLGQSHLEGNTRISLPNGNFQQFLNEARINMNLKARISNSLLEKFITLPKDLMPLEIKLSAFGGLNDFEFSNLEFNQEAVELKGKLNVKDVLSDAPINALFELKDLKIINSKLIEIFPTSYYDQISKSLLKYKSFVGSGTLSIKQNQLRTDLRLVNGEATIVNRSLFNIDVDKDSIKLISFQGVSEIEKIDLSPLHSRLGLVTSKFKISGGRGNSGGFFFNLDADELKLDKKVINNILLQGELKDEEFTAKLKINDKFINASSDMAYSWAEEQHKYQVNLNLDKLNLHHLDFQFGGGKAIYSGDINLFLVGNTLDEIQGNLLFKNIQFENKYQVDSFNDFILETSFSHKKRVIRTINSDILNINIEGDFQLSKLGSLFYNAIAEVFPFMQKEKVIKSQELVYDINLETSHLNAVLPYLVFDKKAVFRGVLSTQNNLSKMTLNIPKISFKTFNAENIAIQFDNQNPLFNTFISVGKIDSDLYQIRDFYSVGVETQNAINFSTEFLGGNNKNDVFQFNYSLLLDGSKKKILINRSTVHLGSNTWIINPKLDQQHWISYDPISQRAELNFLDVQSEDEQIQVKGNYVSSENFGLSLKMDKVSLQNLTLSNERFNLNGVLDLNLDMKRSSSNNSLKFNGSLDDFEMNHIKMGSLLFFTSGNTKLNSYEVNMLLSHQGNTTMSAKGNIISFDQSPRLDLDFSFDDFDLSFLTPIGAGDIDEIRGKVSGDINLWGPLYSPKHNGELILNEGGLRVPDINTNYKISNGTRVSLVDQSFNFNKTTISDIQFNTQAELVGQIYHSNFTDWGFDVDIESDRILMLNIPEEKDKVFFGDGFLDGKVHLHGPSKSLTIDVVGSTEEGTSIKIPWANDYGLPDTSFIKFSATRKADENEKKSISELYNFTGLQMNFELDVNNNAEIKVVIDKESGSFLSGHGAGNILMEIDTNGKFNMWGDFISYDGIYNFKNLSVIDKKFNLRQGGTIVWEGDPLGAQMDLVAVYQVPGGANPAILLDNPNFNRKIPTEVLIRLQGNLLKPDDPIFEIHFPNTSAVVNSEISYRLSDPQISQLQAISLLSQGIFINEVSLSVQGITNNLYEKVSDLFSNIMGDDKGKLQVGLNYLQGDRSKILDSNSEDRLGLTLSTQITDKILLNGNIGVPVGGIEETLIVGDLQIDFILNEEGNLKAKVFNKENEFRYIGDELGYTQGLGLSYQVDFETFRELINKIVKGKGSGNVYEEDSLFFEPSNSAVNFINKN